MNPACRRVAEVSLKDLSHPNPMSQEGWISGALAPPPVLFLVALPFCDRNGGFPRQMGTFFKDSEPPELQSDYRERVRGAFSPIAKRVVRFRDSCRA